MVIFSKNHTGSVFVTIRATFFENHLSHTLKYIQNHPHEYDTVARILSDEVD